MGDLLDDLGYGLRLLWRHRVESSIIILTLALGIGANTAMFSVVRGVLLKPLPYANSDRLVLLRQSALGSGVPDAGISIKEYFTYREQAQHVESLVEYHQMCFDLLERGEPDRVSTGVVSHNFLDVPIPFQIQGQVSDNADRRPTVDRRIVSPRYFDVLKVPLVQGRAFRESDDRTAPNVAIINRSMARYWTNGEPVGSSISLDGGQNWLQVVGIVGDVRQFGLDRGAVAQVYTPLRQIRGGLAGSLLLRTRSDPDAMMTTVRQTIRSLDAAVPIENMRSLDDLTRESTAGPRITATLLALFAGIALTVTLAGLTGVMATTVSQRTQEFGVRMALGAERHQVLRMVLGQGVTLVGIGVVMGAAGALALGRVLTSLLYETAPGDPVAIAISALMFLACGALACLGPAWRAVAVDPLRALRSE